MKLVFLCIFSIWTQISCSILKSDRGKNDNEVPVGDRQSESPRELPEDNDNPGDNNNPDDPGNTGDNNNPDNPGNTGDIDNPPAPTTPGAPPTRSDDPPSQVRVSVSLDQGSDPEKGHRKLKINVEFSLPVTDFELSDVNVQASTPENFYKETSQKYHFYIKAERDDRHQVTVKVPQGVASGPQSQLNLSSNSLQFTFVKRPLIVLTYNICWECMTNSSTGSAGSLGARCMPVTPGSTTTICAQNMAEMVAQIPEGLEAGFDFIGFQEASRWNLFQTMSPTVFTPMTAQHFIRGAVDRFVTFFDTSKYTIRHRIDWGFRTNGRPYQILIFDEGLIFVNLHNCHGACVDPNFVQTALSNSLTRRLTPNEINQIRDFRIIMVGDFNDHSAGGRLRSFQPFLNAGISTRVSVSNPPATCCSTGTPWASTRSGDYILDSETPYQIKIPANYNRQLPQSDHLPVLGILKALP